MTHLKAPYDPELEEEDAPPTPSRLSATPRPLELPEIEEFQFRAFTFFWEQSISATNKPRNSRELHCRVASFHPQDGYTCIFDLDTNPRLSIHITGHPPHLSYVIKHFG